MPSLIAELIGPSGSGKTTLANLTLASHLLPSWCDIRSRFNNLTGELDDDVSSLDRTLLQAKFDWLTASRFDIADVTQHMALLCQCLEIELRVRRTADTGLLLADEYAAQAFSVPLLDITTKDPELTRPY